MAGETGRFMTRLTGEMKAAAAELDFERAARLRDDIGALERVLEKSAVVLPDATDADVFALAEDELEVAVQLFHVRGGRVRGQRGWVAERDAETTPDVVEHLLQQVYGSEAGDAVPREVLVPVLPDDAEALSLWLSALRGSRVDLRVPRRGDKRTLMETVARNAKQSLARHKVTRAGDLTTRSQALQQLQDTLELDEAPLRIECFDISHVQGTQVVGSMVVFEDGLPRKSEYRRFIVRGDETGATDDTAAMHEVLTRRFRRGQREEAEVAQRDAVALGADGDSPEVGARPARFAYRPNLVVVDGGLPQVNAAARALADCRGRRRRRGRARQAARGGVGAGGGVPRGAAAHQRGALPPAAAARRGAPLRDHLPPAAPVEGDDDQPARRHPRPGGEAAQGAAQGSSGRSRGSGPPRSTSSPTCPA